MIRTRADIKKSCDNFLFSHRIQQPENDEAIERFHRGQAPPLGLCQIPDAKRLLNVEWIRRRRQFGVKHQDQKQQHSLVTQWNLFHHGTISGPDRQKSKRRHETN